MSRLTVFAYLQAVAVVIALFLAIINRWEFLPTLVFGLFMSNGIGIMSEFLTALTWKRMRLAEKRRITRVLYWTILITFSVCIGSIGGAELYRRIFSGGYIHVSRNYYPALLLFNGLIAVVATSWQIVYGNLKTRIERKARENQDLQLRQIQAQLIALQAKINPHFLFNTLNAMLSLLQKDPDKVEKMILNLSDIYRRVLRLAETGKIPLADEATLLREYLEIEKIRLGDRLSYALDIDPALAQARILPLLLEPLVENAVIHGIGPEPGGGHISIRATRSQGTMRVTVSDNGSGLDPSKTGGFGLRSVRERMRLAYAERGRLDVQSPAGGGTIVSLEIPLEDQNADC